MSSNEEGGTFQSAVAGTKIETTPASQVPATVSIPAIEASATTVATVPSPPHLSPARKICYRILVGYAGCAIVATASGAVYKLLGGFQSPFDIVLWLLSTLGMMVYTSFDLKERIQRWGLGRDE